VALGAYLRCTHGICGLISAAAALKLKDSHAADISSEWIVRHKLSVGLKAFHANRHVNSPSFQKLRGSVALTNGVVATGVPARRGSGNPLGISDPTRLLTRFKKKKTHPVERVRNGQYVIFSPICRYCDNLSDVSASAPSI
jgi:hypothetical protein